MGEIGSEFWDVPIQNGSNTLFPASTEWYLAGRSALQAIIKELGDSKCAALPSWCCDSMIQPFLSAGWKVRFYPVYWQDGLIQEVCGDCDIFVLMDYFGYTAPCPGLEDYDGNVIRDVTHSILSNAYSDADYYFGSLRKWCGFWTGGYAWARDGHRLISEDAGDHGYTSLRKKAMLLKEQYIHGGEVTDKAYLSVFEQAENALEKTGISPAAERDVHLAKQLDVEMIRKKRRENAELLMDAFPEWLMFHELKKTDTPLFVPVLVPEQKRDALRRYLISNEIYCPVHWPVSACHKLDDRERFIYENELSLVCDQRYSAEDMQRIIDTIRSYMEGI